MSKHRRRAAADDGRPAPEVGAGRYGFPLAVAAAFLVPFLATSGVMWAAAVYQLIVSAGPLAAWIAGATGLGLVVLKVVGVKATRPLLVVTAAAVGLGVLSLVTLALGLAGLLNRYTAWGVVIAGIAAGAVVFRRMLAGKNAAAVRSVVLPDEPPVLEYSSTEPAGRTRRPWAALILMPLLAFATVAAFVPSGLLWRDEPNGYDVVEYHLQIPREWYEAGRITPLTHNAFSFFPQGVEAHFLLAMHLTGGPWAGMYLAQLMHVAFVVLSVAAVYAVALELTGDTRRARLAMLAAGSVPWLALLAPVAYNEGGLMLFGTLAVGWLLRNNGLRGAAVAGLMAGFACGVKLTGVPLVLLAAPLAVAVTKRAWRAAAICVVVGTLTFAPWLVRNVAWVGNPVFPEATAVFGKAHFSDTQVERWRRAHSPRADQAAVGARVTEFGRQVVASREYGWLLLPLGVVACAMAWRDRNARAVAAMVAITAVFWVGFTHLQGRFFTPAIPWLALLLAFANFGVFRWPAVLLLFMGALSALAPRFGQVQKVAPAIGLDDFTPLLPAVLADVPKEGDLALVGEAKAFLYQRPVRYRTVFDVDARPEESAVDAWARGFLGVRLVDPNELVRFHRTYFGIPDPGPMPDQPFLIAPPVGAGAGPATARVAP